MSYERAVRPPHPNLLQAMHAAGASWSTSTRAFALEVLGPAFLRDKPVRFWAFVVEEWAEEHGAMLDTELPWRASVASVDSTAVTPAFSPVGVEEARTPESLYATSRRNQQPVKRPPAAKTYAAGDAPPSTGRFGTLVVKKEGEGG